MKNKFVVSLVLGALVLVGGGCLGKKAPPTAPAAVPSGGAAADTGSALDAELPPADVDAAVDDIIKSMDAEATSDDEASDAGDLDTMMSDTKDLEGTSL